MRAKSTVIGALALLAFSQPALAANITGEAVVLRALDKITATTSDYTVAIGDTLTYGSLRVDVKHCEKRPPEEIPETYAFLQIFDDGPLQTETDGKVAEDSEPKKVFSGWMLSSNPAVSALDHRVYDIWVLGCKTKAADGAPTLR